MKPNEIKPEAFENKLPAAAAAGVEECVNMCTLQYYCPQPITCARLAHSYVPFQFLYCLYPPEKGLAQGTIFPELDRPYGVDPEYAVDQ